MTEDFNPDLFRAQLDQAQAAFRDLAPAIGEFYKGLVEAGMPVGAATSVVCTWVAGLFQQGKGSQ
jgi:hypothetical protein